MAILKVSILQARIDNATRLNVANPLTKAIGKALGTLGVYILGGVAFDAGKKLFTLSEPMKEWNIRWMAGANLDPVEFEVEVPAELVQIDDAGNDGED